MNDEVAPPKDALQVLEQSLVQIAGT